MASPSASASPVRLGGRNAQMSCSKSCVRMFASDAAPDTHPMLRLAADETEGKMKQVEDRDEDGALSIKDYKQLWGTWSDGSPGNETKSHEELFQILLGHDQRDNVMVAFTAHSNKDTAASVHGSKDRGIFLSHAYSLISVLEDVADTGRNFFKIRNPHGRGEWEGPWSALHTGGKVGVRG